MTFVRQTAGGVELTLKVVPGASRDRILGPLGDALKVQVAAAPERGRANASVVELLAVALGVPRRSVQLLAGLHQPRKTVLIVGLSEAEVAQRLSRRGR